MISVLCWKKNDQMSQNKDEKINWYQIIRLERCERENWAKTKSETGLTWHTIFIIILYNNNLFYIMLMNKQLFNLLI